MSEENFIGSTGHNLARKSLYPGIRRRLSKLPRGVESSQRDDPVLSARLRPLLSRRTSPLRCGSANCFDTDELRLAFLVAASELGGCHCRSARLLPGGTTEDLALSRNLRRLKRRFLPRWLALFNRSRIGAPTRPCRVVPCGGCRPNRSEGDILISSRVSLCAG